MFIYIYIFNILQLVGAINLVWRKCIKFPIERAALHHHSLYSTLKVEAVRSS